jgi:hypothetical protein
MVSIVCICRRRLVSGYGKVKVKCGSSWLCHYVFTSSPSVIRVSTHAVKVNCFLLSKGHYVVFLDFTVVVCQVVVFLKVFGPHGG